MDAIRCGDSGAAGASPRVRLTLLAILVACALLACAAGCEPYRPHFAASLRADRQPVGGTSDFIVTSPRGRWVVTPFEAGEPAFLVTALWDTMLQELTVGSRGGLQFCRVPRLSFIVEGDAPADSMRPACDHYLQFLAYELAPGDSTRSPAQVFQERLARVVAAAPRRSVPEPDFWRGLRWTEACVRLREITIDSLRGRMLCLADCRRPDRDIRDDPQVLLFVEGTTLIAVGVRQGELEPGTEAWDVISSLRIVARDGAPP